MGNLYSLFTDGQRRIAILIDPDKEIVASSFSNRLNALMDAAPDVFFVGGSTGTREQTTHCISMIREKTNIPTVLFPGNSEQFTDQADALLLLSLISGRNPKYLIEEQVKSAREIHRSRMEVISTGYILVDGGTATSTSRISATQPIDPSSSNLIIDTALAGTLMGHSCIYLDAGSGAKNPVSAKLIASIASFTSLLIVGGGLRNLEAIRQAHDAGANLVVIGNALEQDASLIPALKAYQENRNPYSG